MKPIELLRKMKKAKRTARHFCSGDEEVYAECLTDTTAMFREIRPDFCDGKTPCGECADKDDCVLENKLPTEEQLKEMEK